MQNSSNKLTRRQVLKTGGLALAGLSVLASPFYAQTFSQVEIRMRSVGNGEHVMFDPVGLLIEPGTVVRWVLSSGVHTATAYHPDNDNHQMRIPERAKPWNSGYLINPGDSFEIKLTTEGVYDYFCAPHELAGMVGRIIVGRPSGPGSLHFDYHHDRTDASDWIDVPEAARWSFPTIDEIMLKRIVSHI